MEEQTRSWLRGCAIGCGALVFLAVALLVGLTISVMRPLNKAVETRIEIEERVGTEDAFTPRSDGSMPADRIEAFIHVREDLQDICSDVTGRTADMAALEAFDQVENPPKREVLLQAMKATKGAMGLGPLLGDLHLRRNLALLEVEMGLGEYSYIYVMAYHGQILSPGEQTGIMDGSPVNRRIHGVLAAMLARQLETATDLSIEQLATLENEVGEMTAEGRRIPWQDGFPATISDSFSPFRDQLDHLFCPAMTEMELLRATKRSFGIESE